MKYVLAFSEETEHLDSNLFDTLEDAEKTAKKVIKLYNEKGYTVDIEDLVSGEPDGEHIDSLVVISVEYVGLPNFGYIIEGAMTDFYSDEGIEDDFYFEKEDQEKLDDMIKKFFKENSYDNQWYTAQGYKVVNL